MKLRFVGELGNTNGNVIFVATGKGTANHEAGISAAVEIGYIIADDGTEIEATRNLSNDKGFDTDCHGTCFAEGQVWINNEQVKSLLEHDGFKPVKMSEGRPGDVVVYIDDKAEVMHSAFYESSSSSGVEVTGLKGLATQSVTENIDAHFSSKSKQVYRRDPSFKARVNLFSDPPIQSRQDNLK